MILTDLVRAMRSFEYDAARGRFRDYLTKIAANAARRHLGKQSPRRLDTAVGDSITTGDGLERDWHEQWIRHHYATAYDRLRKTIDSRDLTIFEEILRGTTIREVAEKFGLTMQATHKVKQRMRDRLREQIRLQIEDEDGLGRE